MSAAKRKKLQGKRKAAPKKAATPAVQLIGERVGKQLKVTATHDGRIVHFDKLDFDRAEQRERFIKGVCKRLPGVDAAALEADLLKLPDTLPTPPPEGSSPEPDTPAVKVVLTYAPGPTGQRGTVTVDRDGETIHIDNALDPANAKHRTRFLKTLAEKISGLDKSGVEAKLLEIAEQNMVRAAAATSHESHSATTDTIELDISCIVRPEQCFTPKLSALAVPVAQLCNGQPAARWVMYRRWADGRRECVELTNCIDLADGRRLWVHPVPGEPAMNTAPGWSTPSRHAWLSGAASPDPAELFKRICARIAHFIDLPSDTAAGTIAILTLWIIQTYVFQAWDAIPYLYVGGPAHSGKTTLFAVLNRLAYRPLASSNLTGPALFRTLHDRGGTLLLDEAERLRQTTPDQQELMSMLLAGYKRGGQATRLEPVGDSFRTVAFDVYGPKALACIAGLPPALSSRCIRVMMFRASPDSPKPKRRIDADPAGWQSLRDDLHVLALEYGPVWLKLSQQETVCPQAINGRNFELWQPLLALACWIESQGAGGLLELVQQHALDSIDSNKDDDIPEADETLLEILTEKVRKGWFPTPGEILTEAQIRDPATFGKPDGKGPHWQASTVTRRLKAYGVPRPSKSNGERRFRDVTLEMLRRVERHYGIDLGFSEPTRACPQGPTLTDPTDPVAASGCGNGRVSQGR